jgi:hypothetical protein
MLAENTADPKAAAKARMAVLDRWMDIFDQLAPLEQDLANLDEKQVLYEELVNRAHELRGALEGLRERTAVESAAARSEIDRDESAGHAGDQASGPDSIYERDAGPARDGSSGDQQTRDGERGR